MLNRLTPEAAIYIGGVRHGYSLAERWDMIDKLNADFARMEEIVTKLYGDPLSCELTIRHHGTAT